MNVRPLFVANAQAAKLIEPGEGSFHDPPPLAQSAAVFGVALRKKRHDASATQTLPDRPRIITAGAPHAIRTTAGSSALSL
jgi:hypothetical protein